LRFSRNHFVAAAILLYAGNAAYAAPINPVIASITIKPTFITDSAANPFGTVKKNKGDTSFPSPNPTIVGGTLASNDGANVAVYYTRTANDYGQGDLSALTADVVCSGVIIPRPPIPNTIVSTKFILTAKKCLPTAVDLTNTKYRNFSVIYATGSSAATRSTSGVKPVFASTKYDVVDFWAIDNDVAILEVAANIPGTIPKALYGIIPGQQLTTNAGYGQSSTTAYTTYGSLHTSTYNVVSANSAAIQLSATGAAYPCEGDLGSPLYGTSNSVKYVFGVMTTITCLTSGNVVVPVDNARTTGINASILPTYYGPIQQYYLAYFGRPADVGGQVLYYTYLQNNSAPKTIEELYVAYDTNPAIKIFIDNFSSSAESMALYAGMNDTNFVNTVYKNIRNRLPTTSELNPWLVKLSSASLPITRGKAALGILTEVLKGTNITDLNTIGKKTKVATNFTNTLANRTTPITSDGTTVAATSRAMVATVVNITDVNIFQATVNATVNGIP
jgi:hypothetical protein